jgi:flagellar basal body-associated protein FliL
MLEFILIMLIVLVTGFILAMLTSIFMAYATQANYVDETYDDHDD